MTDRTHPDSGFPIAYSHYATYAEYVEALHARIAGLEAQLEAIGAGGVSGPLMGKPQEMPDLTTLTERGAKAWAGVDARELREGAASAGSEPVARADSWTNDQWIDLAQRHANADWDSDNPDGYLNAVKALCNDFAAANPSPPEGMVGGWIASKDQMPPPGVRVFWGDVDSHRVGYDSWAGDDYRWTPSHWMHIPDFPAPPTTSAGSKGE